METRRISGTVLQAAMKIHTKLGPGLLESAYRACMCHELKKASLEVQSETVLPITYDGVSLDIGYRVDLLVEDVVLVELKAVSKILPLHEAQILSYLKLSGKPIGLLINFHVPHLREGIKRYVNNAAPWADIKAAGLIPKDDRGPAGRS